ncbi:MAG: tRNA (adenosine(37)-N6)-dimethylallyltransferase MiaA [Spirochaetales bacterium]|nr:tRNA (adenosine(37)-N6)-dimethylallyltransferase MiaA [Spirochaetales bacterium]
MASNKVLVLYGPTGSGKTALIERTFLEKPEPGLRPAFVVSADSMQVYRGMDLGTAKPSAGLRARLPHALVDVRDPSESFSVGDFARLADEACEAALDSGRLPVVSGGTGFYIRNFVLGLSAAPEADPAIRESVSRQLAEEGPTALRAELEAGDPVSAARIAAADHYRLARAVEVLRSTGRPLSSFERPAAPRTRWDFVLVELVVPRAELYARIDARAEAMFAAGLPAEVDTLVRAGYGPAAPGLRAIGYREFLENPRAPDEDEAEWLDRVLELVKRNSRRYAKRQLTFFSGLPGATRVAAGDEATFRALLRERFADS